ncbi:glycoside hydrolase family 1 protein [Clostridium sp. AL.422]|uniref:glycoside hydrolase family 1 protein n=1 Tax=Clostridium TaxID=1485 RepID=UPI00293DEC86|nr:MULTISPECIES: glycoside hydrolase family 1 protein [unclassified Clostridium]MDV4152097.1 glycoside hydrolase family 1 protein [Clostridium sp. AL.422]
MTIKYNFPENFWWGSATSGPQSEGDFNKPHKSVFDYWYEIEPEAFFDKVGPSVTSNFYNSYKEDLAMLKEIGLNSFRTSIQWTRLIKDLETGEPDEDAIRFYNDVIDETIKNGMIPVMNLHHFDLPIELYNKYGGWESKHVVDLFVKFAETAFKLFSDRVKHWTTFNEPIVVVEGQYLYQFHYPKIVDGVKAIQVLYNINLASAKAIKKYRELECDKDGGKIGIILNLTPAYPRSNSEADLRASKIADSLFNNSFLEPAVNGEFPEILVELLTKDNVLWNSTEEELKIIKENTIDFLGVNYYQPRRVMAKESKFDESKGWMPDKYFDNYDMPNKRMNPYRGWEIYPKAMYDIAINIRDNYNNIPWYISENGMGVEGEEIYINENGSIEDDYRIDFFKEHLEYLHKGIEEGSNCFGFHSWTPIDCWSWSNAYKNRYGYIALDLKTLNKSIKKSGRWIKEVSENNGF